MHRLWLFLGAVAGLVAVALAAWAAHGAPASYELASRRSVDSALTMQGWHALALLATGLMVERGRGLANLAGACFALGILLFCGAVWWNVTGGAHLPIPLAPVGGTLLMAGWAALAIAALKR